jgi:acetylornithine/succinyldiaminopimelate/putrescine aminotransferase
MGSVSTTWTPKYREPFEPLVPGVRFCPLNDLSAVSDAVGEGTAAIMVEPVQGEGGIRPATPEFLKGLREMCRERGALLVFDEIQCGLPMGAVLLREDLAPAIQVGDHGSTFGGNPVAAAAALAVLDRLTAPGFLDDVGARGLYLTRGLRRLAKRHKDRVADVRGMGLMLGVELRGPAAPVVKGLRERGILAVKSGESVLRLLPPLVVKRSEMKRLLDALDEVLASKETET